MVVRHMREIANHNMVWYYEMVVLDAGDSRS